MTSSAAQSNPAVAKLLQVIRTTQPSLKPTMGCPYGPRFIQKPPKEISKSVLCGVDCDEVYPNIFVGDERSSRSKDFLHGAGITHVLNTAEGNNFGQVSTGSGFYYGSGIQYLGLDLLDVPDAPVSKYFERSSSFIDSAINSGGKVLVHCLMGLSRSTTFVAAYLIIKKSMTAEEALRAMRLQRDVRPNDGFLLQLTILEDKVRSRKPI